MPASIDDPHWTTITRATVHAGRVTLVDHTVRLPDGTVTGYEVDESVPFAVATLVIDGADVLLTRQYRYPIDRWIVDLPAGAGEQGETPIESAARELREELGLVADDLSPLHDFFPNPGRSAWAVHVFVATGVRAEHAPDDSDPAEQVRLERVPIAELDRRIGTGEIVDPTLIVARAAAAVRGILPPLGPDARRPRLQARPQSLP